jgi:hypothetical protein
MFSRQLRLGSVVAVVVVAGCVTVPSNIVPVGKDTYQLSMTGVGFATQANTNVKAHQSNLTFLCLDANDPDYTHGKIQTNSTVSN